MDYLSDRKRLHCAEKWTSVNPWQRAAAAEGVNLQEPAAPPYTALRNIFIAQAMPFVGRGLHLSTFRLNLSAFCGIWGAFRSCLGGV
jgi:hypothetical protein